MSPCCVVCWYDHVWMKWVSCYFLSYAPLNLAHWPKIFMKNAILAMEAVKNGDGIHENKLSGLGWVYEFRFWWLQKKRKDELTLWDEMLCLLFFPPLLFSDIVINHHHFSLGTHSHAQKTKDKKTYCTIKYPVTYPLILLLYVSNMCVMKQIVY